MNVSTSRIVRFLAPALTLSLAAAIGCSNSIAPDVTNITAATSTVPVMITDAPSDQLVSFSLTLNSITLKDSAGKSASILATPTTVEICHLNGIQAPLITAAIPQDTYTSAVITFSSPQITYIDSTTKAPVVATPVLATTSFTFTFPTAFTVSNSSTSLLIDLLAGQSIAISGTTVTVTPTFLLKPIPPASAAPIGGQNGTGLEGRGAVVSATATSLIVQPPSGSNVTFTLDSHTVFQGVTSVTALMAGELVEVDFTIQTGGVLLANRVELEPLPSGGPTAQSQLGGPIVSAPTGTSFQIASQQGMGKGMSATSVTSLYTINFNTATIFSTTRQFVSLAGLPFTPTFTASTIKAGQVVDVAASSITGNAVTASNVVLDPQTLTGTVTAISTSGGWKVFTLTLTPGSAFATLSGATTITVYASSATAIPVPVSPTAVIPPVVVGATVRFNGLVFANGTGFAMIAGFCPDGDPNH